MPSRPQSSGDTDPRGRIRVLWVMKELAVGGAERLLLEIDPVLADEVEFFPAAVFDEPDTFREAYRTAGFEVLTLGATSHLPLGWMRKLRALVDELNPDLVHLHLPYVGALGRIALSGKHRPIVYTEHNLWRRYRPLTRFANTLTYAMNDAVIPVSRAVEDQVSASRLGRRVRERSRVIYNGVAADGIARDAHDQAAAWPESPLAHPAYGTVGHLRFTKGVDVLLRASLDVSRSIPTATGYVVGEGEDAGRLDAERRALGAPVHFLGSRHDARGLIDAFDVFVMPSRVEGLPVALLEAMVLGKPIVATRAGGIPEALTHNESGLLVEIGDGAGLAAAIVELLADPELGRRLGARARQVARERFSAEATGRGYLTVYESLVRGVRR